jgi:hypothetical protein
MCTRWDELHHFVQEVKNSMQHPCGLLVGRMAIIHEPYINLFANEVLEH